ncbi:hypothetical protein TTHERM_01551970, partial (macronuclear) [Tetrahymena thermophila SB210]
MLIIYCNACLFQLDFKYLIWQNFFLIINLISKNLLEYKILIDIQENQKQVSFYKHMQKPSNSSLSSKFQNIDLKNQVMTLIGREKLSNLLSELSKCSNLITLILNLYFFNNKDLEYGEFGCELAKLQKLKQFQLNFSQNQVTEQFISEFSSGFEQLPNILELNLNFNKCKMDSYSIFTLVSAIQKRFNLTKLNLNMNSIQIDQNSLSELSSNLSKLTILEFLTLNLESNNIIDEGAIGLSQAILQLVNLRYLILTLNNNKITSIGVSNLIQSLEKCKDIFQLNLIFNDNQISDQGVKSLGQGLSKYLKLTELSIGLSGNKISDEGVIILGQYLTNCIELTKLSISLRSQFVTCQGIETFSIELNKCSKLYWVDIEFDWNKTIVNNTQDLLSSENIAKYQSFSIRFQKSSGTSFGSYSYKYVLKIKLWFNQLLMWENDMFFGFNQLDKFSHFEMYLNCSLINDQIVKDLGYGLARYQKLQYLILYLQQFY